VGIFADRAGFVSAGQIYTGTAVSGVVSTPFAEYFPTLVEIAIVLGAFGFLGLAYTLAERYLPMGEHTGHLAGGFLAPSHPAPAMATAGVAWIAAEDVVELVDGAGAHVAAPADEALADAIALEAPAEAVAATEVPAVDAVGATEVPAADDRPGDGQ
jgi:hypothetical protein